MGYNGANNEPQKVAISQLGVRKSVQRTPEGSNQPIWGTMEQTTYPGRQQSADLGYDGANNAPGRQRSADLGYDGANNAPRKVAISRLGVQWSKQRTPEGSDQPTCGTMEQTTYPGRQPSADLGYDGAFNVPMKVAISQHGGAMFNGHSGRRSIVISNGVKE
ncbi:hypothetical protein EPH95_05725 [Salicibibacter halophilus]|uniref:Uncharacterized protein n=1 Tax=Salicibibacter halophilus TaxID=2502791 RepID=A0A514LFU1_9BACI|nr:hypothetical protein EPH95_05725 [Salicibibacter halophilus]